MSAAVFQKGDHVIVAASPETHDFGEIAGIVMATPGHPDDLVMINIGASCCYVSPDLISHADLAPLWPARRARDLSNAFGIIGRTLLVGSLVGAVLLFATRARAQSPLDFVQAQQQIASAPGKKALRRGKPQLVLTGRRVTTALPVSPPPFIRGELVCAANVNRFRAKLGLRTTGSLAAMSFRKLTPATHTTPGAVQVSRRRGGGHAELVAGGGMCWNPSYSRQRWMLVPCSTRRNVIGWYV